MGDWLLALDQGTTSSRALLFDPALNLLGVAQQEFPQLYPRPGEVEHDPDAIWESQVSCARRVLEQVRGRGGRVAALGIANQRETTLLWDRHTGRPAARAIVWQSRVSEPICRRLKEQGTEPVFRARTGLMLDPYFSGTKITWLLEQNPTLRGAAERGDLLFGTVDSWLIWNLTGGKVHATDVSNASRTLLFNIHTLDWDDELLRLLGVPRAMLPEVRPTSGDFGVTAAGVLGESYSIRGVAGDQQAAMFGQACLQPGQAKNTYGTGCFLLLNTGDRPVASQNGLLTTVGWQVAGQTTYCLEGAVFVAGAAVQWLRDGLGMIGQAAEIEELALRVPDTGGVYFVPAFVGLGAPWWNPTARGAIVGLTRGTGREHIARAALESIAWQTLDVLQAMERDAGVALSQLQVDGGASRNNLLMQFQADVLQTPVRRPVLAETTAVGAAALAGLASGVWSQAEQFARQWQLDREFQPHMSVSERDERQQRWHQAVSRSRDWS
ncbi:MAG: glycerol kinase GlpK [Planctomycetaceae bacterium]